MIQNKIDEESNVNQVFKNDVPNVTIFLFKAIVGMAVKVEIYTHIHIYMLCSKNKNTSKFINSPIV